MKILKPAVARSSTKNAIVMMPQKTNRKGVIPSGWKEEQSRPGMGECDRSGRTRRGIKRFVHVRTLFDGGVSNNPHLIDAAFHFSKR
jgi:hypothetical protein